MQTTDVRGKNIFKKFQHASCTDVGVIWHEIHLLIGTLHFAQSSIARLTGSHETIGVWLLLYFCIMVERPLMGFETYLFHQPKTV